MKFKIITKHRIIEHSIVLLIMLRFIHVESRYFEDFFSFKFVNSLILLTIFYIHALFLVPLLKSGKQTSRYIIKSFLLFAFSAILISFIKIYSKSDYIYWFTRMYYHGPAAGDNLLYLYKSNFSDVVLYFLFSLFYGLLLVRGESRFNSLVENIFKSKFTEILINVVILIIVYITLYFSKTTNNIPTFSFVLFYIHIFFVAPLLIEKKKVNLFSFLTILESFVYLLLCGLVNENEFPFYISLLISIISLSSLYCFIRLKYKENLQLSISKDAEVKMLKNQINPHFLFNVLNTLYAFALKEHAEDTATNIKKFSNLIRFNLKDLDRDFIDLDREYQYIQDYIDIQLARYPIKHKINLHFDNIVEKKIAPMLLIPIVENAFKHGFSAYKKSHLNLFLIADNEKIIFNCENSLSKQEDFKKDLGLGIGLKNVQERLNLIYRDRHSFKIEQTENMYKVKIEIYD